MKFDVLNDDNYVMYAMKHYDNPQCVDMDEFYDDLHRTKYIKRLFNRYKSKNDLQERLILNHIIIFYNVFGIIAATKLLFFRISEEYHTILKTFLIYLNYIKSDFRTDIKLDNKVTKILREV